MIRPALGIFEAGLGKSHPKTRTVAGIFKLLLAAMAEAGMGSTPD